MRRVYKGRSGAGVKGWASEKGSAAGVKESTACAKGSGAGVNGSKGEWGRCKGECGV